MLWAGLAVEKNGPIHPKYCSEMLNREGAVVTIVTMFL